MPYKDPIKDAKYKAQWRDTHRAEINAKALAYYRKNAEEVREQKRRWYQKNKRKQRARSKAWRLAHPGYRKEQHRAEKMKRCGTTLEGWNAALIAQCARCAVCGEIMKNPHGDHDHKTGKFRGLLCEFCNHGLGNFRDSPAFLRAAANYLEAHI